MYMLIISYNLQKGCEKTMLEKNLGIFLASNEHSKKQYNQGQKVTSMNKGKPENFPLFITFSVGLP